MEANNEVMNAKAKCIGKFEHPIHGLYFIFFDGSCYGISKTEYNGEQGLWCAYSSLASLLSAKGF